MGTSSPHVHGKVVVNSIVVVVAAAAVIVVVIVGCFTSHASLSVGQICSHSCTYCHTEIELADQTC